MFAKITDKYPLCNSRLENLKISFGIRRRVSEASMSSSDRMTNWFSVKALVSLFIVGMDIKGHVSHRLPHGYDSTPFELVYTYTGLVNHTEVSSWAHAIQRYVSGVQAPGRAADHWRRPGHPLTPYPTRHPLHTPRNRISQLFYWES